MVGQDKLASTFQQKASKLLIAIIKDVCDEIDLKSYRDKLAEDLFIIESYQSGSEDFTQMEMVQARFDIAPQDFSIVSLEQGSEEEFKALLNANKFDYLIMENNDDGPARFIIDKEHLEKFKELYSDLVQDDSFLDRDDDHEIEDLFADPVEQEPVKDENVIDDENVGENRENPEEAPVEEKTDNDIDTGVEDVVNDTGDGANEYTPEEEVDEPNNDVSEYVQDDNVGEDIPDDSVVDNIENPEEAPVEEEQIDNDIDTGVEDVANDTDDGANEYALEDEVNEPNGDVSEDVQDDNAVEDIPEDVVNEINDDVSEDIQDDNTVEDIPDDNVGDNIEEPVVNPVEQETTDNNINTGADDTVNEINDGTNEYIPETKVNETYDVNEYVQDNNAGEYISDDNVGDKFEEPVANPVEQEPINNNIDTATDKVVNGTNDDVNQYAQNNGANEHAHDDNVIANNSGSSSEDSTPNHSERKPPENNEATHDSSKNVNNVWSDPIGHDPQKTSFVGTQDNGRFEHSGEIHFGQSGEINLNAASSTENNFVFNEKDAPQNVQVHDKSQFVSTIAREVTLGADNSSFVANIKGDLTIAKNIEGIVADTLMNRVVSDDVMLERLKGTLSDDGRKAFDSLWKADSAARTRLINGQKLSYKEAEATYFQELMEKGSFIKKEGSGTGVFQSKIRENSMPGISTNYFGKERVITSLSVKGKQFNLANSKINVQDTRKAWQIQNDFLSKKATAVFGKDALKDRKIKSQMDALANDFRRRRVVNAVSVRTNAKAVKASFSGKRKIIRKILSCANAKNDDPTTRQVSKSLQYYSKMKMIIRTTYRIRTTLIKRKIVRLKTRKRELLDFKKNTKKLTEEALRRGDVKTALKIKKRRTKIFEKRNSLNEKRLKKVRKKLEKINKKKNIKKSKIRRRQKWINNKKRIIRKKIYNSRFLNKNPVGRFLKNRYRQARYAKLVRKRLARNLRKWFGKTKLGAVLGKMFSIYGKLRMLLMKIIFKLMLLIGKILLAIMGLATTIAITYGGVIIIILMVTQFFYWEGEEEFNQEVESSVMGLVYNDLTNRETEWAKGLKTDFDSEGCAYFDELSYTVFEGDKTTTMSGKEYVEKVLGTEYVKDAVKRDVWFDWHDPTWDAVKGPEPFANAPEEAYKYIITVDGGKELMFIGAGGLPAHTSNAKEIVCMASLVQYESDITYNDFPDKTGFEEGSFFDNLAKAYTNIKNFFSAAKEAVNHVVSNFVNSIGNSLQKAFNSDFYTQFVAKKESRIYYAYTHPLFIHSHAVHFGLRLVILPTAHMTHESTVEGENAEYSKLAEVCPSDETQHTKKVVDEHEGHGCKSYCGFTFNDPTNETLFYNGEAVPQAYPAALIESDPLYNKDIPIAPGNEPEMFVERYTYGNNRDSWSLSTGASSSYEDMDDKPEKLDYTGGLGIGDVVSLGSSDGGATYTAEVISDVSENEEYSSEVFDEYGNPIVESETYNYTLTEYSFSYKGDSGTHKGYYCGGHLILEEYGTVYSFTNGERESIQETYSDKNKTNENPEADLPEYTVIPKKYFNENYTIFDDSALKDAQDLFDIDAILVHCEGVIHKDFKGWSKGSIDNAVAKSLEDWKITYGITTHYTIAGLDADVVNGAGEDSYADADGNPIVGTKMTQAEIDAVIATLESNPEYVNDPAWPARKEAIIKAMSLVGVIGYSQAHHGDALREGGLTDCSGFASGIWHPYFGDVLNTAGFLDYGLRTGTSHPFYANNGQGEYQAKPGDVLIYNGASGRHAVVYMGVVNGTTMSVDIGSPALGCRYMHKKYYGSCTVIDMASSLGLS